jgi:hypothetical protein
MTTRQGKKPRKAITPAMKVNALLNVSHNVGLIPHGILCGYCRNPIFAEQPIEWDHFIPIAMGGIHHWGNLRPLHKKCHAEKSFGSGASTAGSDIGKISKERRIIRTGKMTVEKGPIDMMQALKDALAASDKPKRSWPSKKMQSRKFGKRKTA